MGLADHVPAQNEPKLSDTLWGVRWKKKQKKKRIGGPQVCNSHHENHGAPAVVRGLLNSADRHRLEVGTHCKAGDPTTAPCMITSCEHARTAKLPSTCPPTHTHTQVLRNGDQSTGEKILFLLEEQEVGRPRPQPFRRPDRGGQCAGVQTWGKGMGHGCDLQLAFSRAWNIWQPME